MALFGSKEKDTLSKAVRPTVVRTQNVAKELFSIAKSYDVKPEMLDFNILDVQTYTREEEKDTEWELVSNEELYELDDQKQLLNPSFQIKQTYEIEIFSKTKEQNFLCRDMKMAVGANASKCKVYLSISAGSSIAYSPGLENTLLLEINKRKIRAGILINIFDEMVASVASKLSARVQVAQKLEFEKNETILIAEAYEPTPTTNDSLIFHYEQSDSVDENEKIDYSSRDFIQSVKKDELLIEYVKPQNGKPGRNCRGEYMQPEEPTISNEVTFSVDDTIRVEESEISVQYIAVANGYIKLEDNAYTIKKEVDVGEISFKTTGSISSGVDSDVNISVSESDAIKDAVGTGMEVEVTEIEIDGNVGSNAKVVAKKASVGGQTHKTASIKADNLDINVHKGRAYGNNIHVTRLEHGEIDGDIVDVTQALGGTIKAKEIDLELCASHVKATATRRIEIQKLQGSENSFTIDPLLSKGAQSGLMENKEEIGSLEREIAELKKETNKYSTLVKEGTPAFLDIKKRLVNYKKKGVKMPESFVKKYKQFQSMQLKLKGLQESLEIKADKLALQTTRTSSFQDSIFDARIINKDRWIGYNEIKFKLVDPPMELVYKPKEGSHEKVFGLVDLGDGQFEIQVMDE
jgi:Flagellar Assembly Protein A N-terminal region